MPREKKPSLNEKAFVIRAVQERLHVDGRQFDQYRSLDLSFGEQYGSADVTLGKTRVICNVSAEVSVPYQDRPLDGIFAITTELSPMVSPAFEAKKPPTETAVLLSRVLEKTIRRSGALDTESLCLVAGQKCWSVRADVNVISDDGNLTDAACVAVVAALRHFRKPDTAIEQGVLTVFTPAEREPVPLSWLHSPFCVTFSFYGDGSGGAAGAEGGGGGGSGDGKEGSSSAVAAVLVDACWMEELVRSASCTISLNRHGEVCQVSKLGGHPVEAVTLLQCTAVALAKVQDMAALVDRRLAEDAKRRDKGGLMAELSAENDR